MFGRRTSKVIAPLPVPPFAPDPVLTEPVTPTPTGSPVVAYAAYGVDVAAATSRGEVRPGVEIWTIPAGSPTDALARWVQLRALHEQTGWWPVIVGGEMWESTLLEFGGPESAVEFAAGDGHAWLNRAWVERFGDDEEHEVPRSPTPEIRASGVGWDDLLADSLESAGEIALVPARAGWLAPSVLGWSGAVNWDVMDADHATLLRRWAGHWGVEVVGLSLDVLTVRLLRPPASTHEALVLATEVYLYCPDAVEQGTESLDALAAAVALPAWQLWWD